MISRLPFPLFHLIETLYLLVSGSMHTGRVRWTLKWAHRCTSNEISHTLPVCREEEKKRAFLCILIECPLIHPLSLRLFCHLPLKSVPLLSAHQCQTALWKHRTSCFTSRSVQVPLWPRAGKTVSCTDACRHYPQFQILSLWEWKRTRLGWKDFVSDSLRRQHCVMWCCVCS